MTEPFDFQLSDEKRKELLSQVKAAMPWLETVFQLTDFTKRRMGESVIYYFHSKRTDKPMPISFDILQGIVDGRSKLKWWNWCVQNTGGLFPPAAIGVSDFQTLLAIANIMEVVEEADTAFQDALAMFVSLYEVHDNEKEALAHLKTPKDVIRGAMSADALHTATCPAALTTRCAYITLESLKAWFDTNRQGFKRNELPKYLRESGWSRKERNWGSYWVSPPNWGPLVELPKALVE